MTRRDWEDGAAAARRLPQRRRAADADRTAKPVRDDSFLVLFNAGTRTSSFTLPPRRFGARWTLELTTADPDAPEATVPAPRADVAGRRRCSVVCSGASE